MDSSLARYTDDEGQLWVMCSHCTEWTHEKNLMLDPEDGLRWDVCNECGEVERLT